MMSGITLFQKIFPLYLVVGAGVLAARRLTLSTETVGNILIYIVSPVVIFFTVLAMPLTAARLTLPLLFFALCCTCGLTARAVAVRWIDRPAAGILAFAAGSGNSGYFGLPLTLAILGPDYLGLAILCAVGFTVYENTLGFFLAARGRYSIRQSALALARLPSLYFLVAAITLNLSGVGVPAVFNEVAQQFRGTYTILGMFLIGMSAGRARSWRFDPKLASLGLSFKFVVWPLLMAGVLALNLWVYPFYDDQALSVFPIMAVVPLPAVSAAVAAIFDLRPHDVAMMVLLSTVLALGIIPLELAVFAWAF